MKLGYPCINRTIGCSTDRTFRLKSYSEKRLVTTVNNNLVCLEKVLKYNVEHNILFFRITSELVPFASHPICEFNWQKHFSKKFQELGKFINKHHIRISMHPDQFIVLNSKDPDVVTRSITELDYHATVLNLLGLDSTAKIQLHIGGVYGDKPRSLKRFGDVYSKLGSKIQQRLVIENDDRNYTLSDCLQLTKEIKIPILFDFFHHQLNCSGEKLIEALQKVSTTWQSSDGLPMVDYSSQNPNHKPGGHTLTIDVKDFKKFISKSRKFDFDLMLEIKDKENSAKTAVEILNNDKRFRKLNKVG
jgi:UV DNA damage endonuclease